MFVGFPRKNVGKFRNQKTMVTLLIQIGQWFDHLIVRISRT